MVRLIGTGRVVCMTAEKIGLDDQKIGKNTITPHVLQLGVRSTLTIDFSMDFDPKVPKFGTQNVAHKLP